MKCGMLLCNDRSPKVSALDASLRRRFAGKSEYEVMSLFLFIGSLFLGTIYEYGTEPFLIRIALLCLSLL